MSTEEMINDAVPVQSEIENIEPDISELVSKMSVAIEEIKHTNEDFFNRIIEMLQKEEPSENNVKKEKDRSEELIGSVVSKIDSLENEVKSIAEKQDRNDSKLIQTLRENANFQVQVRRGMQQDIDTYKEQLSQERFDGILKDIATIYVEYGSVLDDESMAERTKKNIRSLFEQLEDVLTDYGAEIVRSNEGEVRRTRITKVINKIPVDDEPKHNTIAKSRKPGVVRDRVVLYPEFVDIYVYEPKCESEE